MVYELRKYYNLMLWVILVLFSYIHVVSFYIGCEMSPKSVDHIINMYMRITMADVEDL